MPFRNPIRRLSQLVADRVIGSLLATADAPSVRIEIGANDNADALPDDTIRFYTADGSETIPAHIKPYASGPIVGLKIVGADLGAVGAAEVSEVSVTEDYLGLDGGSATFGIIDLFSASVIRMRAPTRFAPDGIGGRLLNSLDWGTINVTTSAAGTATITHNLGQVPDVVLTTITTGSFFAAVTNKTANNFQVTLRDDAGALLASVTRTIQWLAIG